MPGCPHKIIHECHHPCATNFDGRLEIISVISWFIYDVTVGRFHNFLKFYFLYCFAQLEIKKIKKLLST